MDGLLLLLVPEDLMSSLSAVDGLAALVLAVGLQALPRCPPAHGC